LASGLVFAAAQLFLTAPALGQTEPEVRVLTVVDYVTGREVYLSVGTDHGIHEGDTLSVYDGEGEGAELLGVFAIQSANEKRSAAAFVSELFSVMRADLLYLGLPEALADARLADAEEEEARAGGAEIGAGAGADEEPVQSAESSGGQAEAAVGNPVQVHGRLSLDMDALQTTTRWGASLGEEATRSFSTPTLRLQARARDLPGGFQLGTSFRLSHRTSPNEAIQPATSARFYRFDLEKSFETVPLQLHLGRFHNPFDDYSGYWDGLMVHYGEDGLGGGVAVGFEPELWNEGVSTQRPKVSGFLDYSARSERASYDGAFSFSALRPESGFGERTYVGLTQRVQVGGVWIRQRLQLDRSMVGSDWSLTRLQVDASLPLSEGLSAHGGWRRWRSFYTGLQADDFGPRHDRATLGLSYWSLRGGLSADVSVDRPEQGSQARTVSSSFYLRRSPLLGLGFSGMASYWTKGDLTSLLLSPEVRRSFGRSDVRAGYRFYETAGDFGEDRSHFADLSISFPLGSGLSARLHGGVQWGDRYSSNRILASLWKSF
jgi:hypothetical protein